MSEASKPTDATARSPMAGCTILIIALLVMVFLVVFSVFSLVRQFREIVKFTDDKPAVLGSVALEGRDVEINALSERLETFRQQLMDGSEARLGLSAAELNLAIAAYPPLAELRGTFRIESIADEGMRIRISFPLNGMPRLAREGEDGVFTTDHRYLNGVLVARPVLLNGEVALTLDGIEVEKAAVPDEFIQQMSPYRPAEQYNSHKTIGPAMRALTRVTLEGGRLVLAGVPGEVPTDAISNAQVDQASSRFLKVLGGAACLFLLFAGTMILLGLRQKARKGDA